MGRAVEASISMSSIMPALPLLLPTNTCWCKRAARPPLGTDRQVMEPFVECRPTISLLSPDSERRCIVDAVEDISS